MQSMNIIEALRRALQHESIGNVKRIVADVVCELEAREAEAKKASGDEWDFRFKLKE